MKNNRREFLKHIVLAGIGLVGAGILPAQASGPDDKSKSNLDQTSR